MSAIDIRKAHRLGLEDARNTADELAAELAEKFAVDYGWDGDVILFERTGVTGQIRVDAREVHVLAQLGFFLGYLKPAVEREIHRYLDEHFA